MKHSPHRRKRTARYDRPQSLRSDYITTSFGDVPKRDIWQALKYAVVFLAFFEGTLLVMGRCYGWL